MPTYIALLRAVNVGGYGKLSMAALRNLLEELGYRRVTTYIQSGNAVFDANGSTAKIARELGAALEKHMHAPVGVIVRTPEELDRIIAGNPFADEAAADGARVHVGFLSAPAPASAAAGLQRIVDQYPNRRDRFHLSGHTLYLHLPDGAADTKFTAKALDKILGGAGTARNWNTVLKLREMAARSDP
ncbi:MAG TPA: DUF1697 domain-containing protein [Terracidiphilus sp.]|jgi:uncharacterized protein (DUF1697 family)|nr:DUF1697 domain-containing protein [Terracidiphilus sp.]